MGPNLESKLSSDAMFVFVTITDVIREDMGFNAFMDHLAKEFSMENLLAIVEMTQYKKRFQKIFKIKHERGKSSLMNVANRLRNSLHGKLTDTLQLTSSENQSNVTEITGLTEDECNDDQEKSPKSSSSEKKKRKRAKSLVDVRSDIIELPSGLPLSAIVYSEKDENNEDGDKLIECKRIVKQLYIKYVLVGSEMEVNLSHKVRQRCLKKYERINEMDQEALFHVFDQCMACLLKLMQDSYVRFKDTPGFKYEVKL